MAVSQRSLQAWFGDHWLRGLPRTVRADAEPQLIAIRQAAEAILEYTPAGPEQSRAVTRLRDQWDRQLLDAWETYLPAYESLIGIWLGDHWVRGFRDEDKERAGKLLDVFRSTMSDVSSGQRPQAERLEDIRGAWLAAMRALRCFS